MSEKALSGEALAAKLQELDNICTDWECGDETPLVDRVDEWRIATTKVLAATIQSIRDQTLEEVDLAATMLGLFDVAIDPGATTIWDSGNNGHALIAEGKSLTAALFNATKENPHDQ